MKVTDEVDKEAQRLRAHWLEELMIGDKAGGLQNLRDDAVVGRAVSCGAISARSNLNVHVMPRGGLRASQPDVVSPNGGVLHAVARIASEKVRHLRPPGGSEPVSSDERDDLMTFVAPRQNRGRRQGGNRQARNPIVALVNTTAQALFSRNFDSGNHIPR